MTVCQAQIFGENGGSTVWFLLKREQNSNEMHTSAYLFNQLCKHKQMNVIYSFYIMMSYYCENCRSELKK